MVNEPSRARGAAASYKRLQGPFEARPPYTLSIHRVQPHAESGRVASSCRVRSCRVAEQGIGAGVPRG